MKTRLLLLMALVAGWLARPAQATTLVRMSLEQLSQAASEIVRARVLSQQCRWNGNHTRIVTITTLAVGETFKGRPPSTIQVEQPGGTVGNIHVRVAGTALLRPRSDYILFLEPSTASPGRFRIVGMSQGAYRLYRDAATREERLILPLGLLTYGGRPAAQGAAGTMSVGGFRTLASAAVRAPIIIPRGISMLVTIQSTESRGAGRMHVLARTNLDLFPGHKVVIPAGSPVEGSANQVAGKWQINWTEVTIRGTRAQISGVSEEPLGSLRGTTLVFNVR